MSDIFKTKEQQIQEASTQPVQIHTRASIAQAEQDALRQTPIKIDTSKLDTKFGTRYDTTFDPFNPEYLKGYEAYASLFSVAKNKEHGDAIKKLVDEQIVYHSSAEYKAKVSDQELFIKHSIDAGTVLIGCVILFVVIKKIIEKLKANTKVKNDELKDLV